MYLCPLPYLCTETLCNIKCLAHIVCERLPVHRGQLQNLCVLVQLVEFRIQLYAPLQSLVQLILDVSLLENYLLSEHPAEQNIDITTIISSQTTIADSIAHIYVCMSAPTLATCNSFSICAGSVSLEICSRLRASCSVAELLVVMAGRPADCQAGSPFLAGGYLSRVANSTTSLFFLSLSLSVSPLYMYIARAPICVLPRHFFSCSPLSLPSRPACLK